MKTQPIQLLLYQFPAKLDQNKFCELLAHEDYQGGQSTKPPL